MKVAIFGGSGKMGQWFNPSPFRRGDGRCVITGPGISRNCWLPVKKSGVPTATNIEAVKKADVVVISVPRILLKTVANGNCTVRPRRAGHRRSDLIKD